MGEVDAEAPDDVAACRDDLRIGAGERMQLEPAIIAPGPAVEADNERTLREQRGKLNECPLAVGHAEVWQNLADLRDLVAILDVGCDAGDELVVCRLHLRQQLARLAKIELEPLSSGAWR